MTFQFHIYISFISQKKNVVTQIKKHFSWFFFTVSHIREKRYFFLLKKFIFTFFMRFHKWGKTWRNWEMLCWKNYFPIKSWTQKRKKCCSRRKENHDYLIGWRIISEAVCICWHSSTIHSKLALTHQSGANFKMRALGHIEHTAECYAAVYITHSKVEVIWHLPYISLWQILHRRNNRLLQSLFRQTCCDSSRAIHNVRVMQRKRGMILFICLPDKRNLHQGD